MFRFLDSENSGRVDLLDFCDWCACLLAKCCKACLVGGVSAYAHAFSGRAMVSATRNDIALQPSRPSQKPAAISPVRRRVVAGKGEMSQGNASHDRYGGRAVLKLK